MTDRPESYRWSSYRHGVGQGCGFPRLDPVAALDGLGQTDEDRGWYPAELRHSKCQVVTHLRSVGGLLFDIGQRYPALHLELWSGSQAAAPAEA